LTSGTFSAIEPGIAWPPWLWTGYRLLERKEKRYTKKLKRFYQYISSRSSSFFAIFYDIAKNLKIAIPMENLLEDYILKNQALSFSLIGTSIVQIIFSREIIS